MLLVYLCLHDQAVLMVNAGASPVCLVDVSSVQPGWLIMIGGYYTCQYITDDHHQVWEYTSQHISDDHHQVCESISTSM